MESGNNLPQNATPSGEGAVKYCTTCGASLHLQAEICPKCGVRQMPPPQMPPPQMPPPQMPPPQGQFFAGGAGTAAGGQAFPGAKFCNSCGTTLNPQAPMCPRCGAPQKKPHGKSKGVAALLSFFLGSFGAQFFYVGDIWSGLFCLLFCWTTLPGWVGIFCAIYYLTLSDEKFDTLVEFYRK